MYEEWNDKSTNLSGMNDSNFPLQKYYQNIDPLQMIEMKELGHARGVSQDELIKYKGKLNDDLLVDLSQQHNQNFIEQSTNTQTHLDLSDIKGTSENYMSP